MILRYVRGLLRLSVNQWQTVIGLWSNYVYSMQQSCCRRLAPLACQRLTYWYRHTMPELAVIFRSQLIEVCFASDLCGNRRCLRRCNMAREADSGRGGIFSMKSALRVQFDPGFGVGIVGASRLVALNPKALILLPDYASSFALPSSNYN